MQNLKRVLSLVLVVAMVMSFMLSASAAVQPQIPDLAESNYQPEVQVLAALNIVEGYEDGSFKPANNVTRAELATILARVRVGGDKEMINTYNYSHMTYTDVLNAGYVWAAPAIQYATDNDMVVGDGNNKFRPGDTVTVVEGLKMLLTALDYDPEIEGLQNVGAAWKANTLSLAREVGLLDRFYGDTNKQMTRDDMALLIFNFLSSNVVKGYYTNDVANVDTVLYFGGTALEVYFGKQVVYGAIVANEAADTDVYEMATTGRVANGDVRLPANTTQLFLYDNDEGVTLGDIMAGRVPVTVPFFSEEKVVDDYFMTFTNLSTDLGDIGEPVFVITDLEPTKGDWLATGGLCFSTGTNTVGTETWDAVATLGNLVNNDTVYVNDYDYTTTAQTNTNGNFLKTVDWDGDGILDIVLKEDWSMTLVTGTNRDNSVNNVAGENWDFDNRHPNLLAEDFIDTGYINYHYADGVWYNTQATTIAKTPLADSIDAVNYREGYVTLSDGNKYEQSDVGTGGLQNMLETILINLRNDPKATANYNWYLDNGGYIRAFGEDLSQWSVYLLTDASSAMTRTGWDETVDALRQTGFDGLNTYTVTNSRNDLYVQNAANSTPVKFGALNTALDGVAATNLASAAVSETSAELQNPGTIVELMSTFGSYGNEYLLRDGNDWGAYNSAHEFKHAGVDHVYTTDNTDYYVVTWALDNYGNKMVTNVEYFKGYKALTGVNFADCSNAYALVGGVQTVADGSEYYVANTVVLETNVAFREIKSPYFAYEHISDYKDSRVGLFATIDPTGALVDVPVTYAGSNLPFNNTDTALGFFSYNPGTQVATVIDHDYNANGIFAANVAIVNPSYKVITTVGGIQLNITENTEIYALVNSRFGNTNNYGERLWLVDQEYGDLRVNDSIIYVVNGINVEYILVVDGDSRNLPDNLVYAQDGIDIWGMIADDNGAGLNNSAAWLAYLKETIADYVTAKNNPTTVSALELEAARQEMIEAMVEYLETTPDFTGNTPYATALAAALADDGLTVAEKKVWADDVFQAASASGTITEQKVYALGQAVTDFTASGDINVLKAHDIIAAFEGCDFDGHIHEDALTDAERALFAEQYEDDLDDATHVGTLCYSLAVQIVDAVDANTTHDNEQEILNLLTLWNNVAEDNWVITGQSTVGGTPVGVNAGDYIVAAGNIIAGWYAEQLNAGTNVTVATDLKVSTNDAIVVTTGTSTLDLNGKTIEQTTAAKYVVLVTGGTLTIKDSGTTGTLCGVNSVVGVAGSATLNIASGTLENVWYNGTSGGSITGGTINTLTVNTKANVIVSGGAFGVRPDTVATLATGYAVYQDTSNVWHVIPYEVTASAPTLDNPLYNANQDKVTVTLDGNVVTITVKGTLNNFNNGTDAEEWVALHINDGVTFSGTSVTGAVGVDPNSLARGTTTGAMFWVNTNDGVYTSGLAITLNGVAYTIKVVG